MTKGTKMVCPECGVEMNHHADKLVHPTDAEAARRVDPQLGGIVEEHHACPECGMGDTRQV
jgi:ribosomal protein S27AE